MSRPVTPKIIALWLAVSVLDAGESIMCLAAAMAFSAATRLANSGDPFGN
jgi:hypothetical protein